MQESRTKILIEAIAQYGSEHLLRETLYCYFEIYNAFQRLAGTIAIADVARNAIGGKSISV